MHKQIDHVAPAAPVACFDVVSDVMDTTSSSSQPDGAEAQTKASLREQIIARGQSVRQLRANGEADSAQAELAALLRLKEQYAQLTGGEYRASKKAAKRARSEDDDGASSPAANGSARLPKQRHKPKPKLQAVGEVDPMALPPPSSTFPAWAPREYFRFEVVHTSRKPGSRARVGRITTPHGVIETPAFVPVGTNAALKALDERQSVEAGTQLMFCNTYHLLVHPGVDVVRGAGGLHAWMGHSGPLITDSGGFQVFSLGEPSEEDGPEMKCRNKSRQAHRQQQDGPGGSSGALLHVSEAGACFRSYHDGTQIELTPESSVGAQKGLGADIIIPLDELPPYHITRERLHASVRLSHRWMARSLRTHLDDPRQQAMYAVVHGGTDQPLRLESAEYLSSLPFDGYAIGGSLGRDRAEMLELLAFLMPRLPAEKPTHLLGIADPESAEAVVPHGIDTLDSCNPTRVARHGLLLTTDGPLKIKSLRHASDYGPIDPKCETIGHSRSYLHHLFKQHEPLFMTLASQHNLIYMHKLMAELRRRILADEI